MIVSTDHQLDAFRADWGGLQILRLLQRHGGRLLVNWPVGVGKSRNLDDLIEAAVQDGVYDTIVVLCPTTQVISERRWVRQPPTDHRIVTLRRRPSEQCGTHRDREWEWYEKAGMGLLGRNRICNLCPHRRQCFWPDQYGENLTGAKVIFGTQAHLERDPFFLEQLGRWTQSTRMLLILDEDNVMLKCFRRRIVHRDLVQFAAAIAAVNDDHSTLNKWHHICRALIIQQRSADLRSGDWALPTLSPKLALLIQEAGLSRYHESFRFLGFDLLNFCRSPFMSRELHRNGDIEFAVAPAINTDVIVYSGTCVPEFAEFRLGIELPNPFQDVHFQHPGTHWFNIANRIGAAKYFPANSGRILDFFASLVARRLREGRRPLLISKKRFVPLCVEGMTARLRALGFGELRIITENWDQHDLNDPNVIALINYGVVGTNLFENFDCAYCLNSYFVNLKVINAIVQDVLATDGYIGIKIETAGIPLRRSVITTNARDRLCDVPTLANYALQQQEMNVVLQAVGRVRFITRPREVITFQAAEHPVIKYDREFLSLGEARCFFEIPGSRQRDALLTTSEVAAAKAAGKTQKQAADDLDVSVRTIQRHWHRQPDTNP